MASFLFKKTTLCLGTLAAVVACVPAGDGRPPSPGRVYFPVGLSVVKDSDRLLVVNSDFDLQFAQGTVQSLSLPRVREVLQKPCTADSDCSDGKICDVTPSEANDNAPAYVCVDPTDGRPCGDFGEKTLAARAVAPGRCSAIDLLKPKDGGDELLSDVAETSAFATEGLLLDRPCQAGTTGSRPCTDSDAAGSRIASRSGATHPHRLLLPVRGDTTIHFLDIDEDGKFVCGRPIEKRSNFSFLDAKDRDLRCSKNFRTSGGTTYGLDSDGNLVTTSEPPPAGDLDQSELDEIDDNPLNDFRLQPEPIDLAATDGGRFVVVSHQVGGVVSTLMNNWLDDPRLIHVLRGLSANPVGVAALPQVPSADPEEPVYLRESTADFLLTYRTDTRVDLLHFRDDQLLEGALSAPKAGGGAPVTVFRPALDLVDSTNISTNAAGQHSRGLVIDDRERKRAIEACGTDADCLALAADVSMTVYVTNRTPASLVVGKTGGTSVIAQTSELPRFYDTIPLTAGPARVVLGSILGADGKPKERVFVICFDSALIYIYDPERRRVETVIPTGRGPYALAFDPVLPVAYVAHFTDSYIGAVSLDQRHLRTYGATLATLGIPEEPRATK